MSETQKYAVVEFLDGAPEALWTCAGEHPDDVTILRASSFNAADPGTVEALIALTPMVIAAVTGVVREQIAARKHVSVKVDGVELTGLSKRDALEVLEQLGQRASR
jgi:hypothetical protein